MFLGHFGLHKCQRSCPNKLVNAKSKKGCGRTDKRTNGVTLSLLELLIAAENLFNLEAINTDNVLIKPEKRLIPSLRWLK